MAYFGENWDDNEFPLAYLITIRTYGTWLHGDERSSVDRHSRYGIYGAARREMNQNLRQRMSENMKRPTFILAENQRTVVQTAVEEVCRHHNYNLHALNVRTNHLHAVVSAESKPEPMANAFKSYATRALREKYLVDPDARLWSRGRSRRYLWDQKHVGAAIDYVLYCQGDDEFEVWYSGRYDD
jgi:REP element-mobilizing transposase RayT